MSCDATCPDCGADGRFGSCAALFDELLALDHARRQPWGRFHGLNVACYLLQHPSAPAAGRDDGPWQLVTAFLGGGLDAVETVTSDRVRANRPGRRPRRSAAPAPPRSRTASYTIEDLSVDGTFPAEGYVRRMQEWARAVASKRRLWQ